MQTQRRALYLDIKLPRPDHDAASVRAVQLIEYLASHRAVDLAVLTDFGLAPDSPANVRRLGARLVCPPGETAIRAHLDAAGPEYDLIVLAWSRTAVAFMSDIRRAAPQAACVFDTVDVNHVREFRHARVAGNARRLHIALSLRETERAAVTAADVTLAVTEADLLTLRKLVPTARVALAGMWQAAIDAPTLRDGHEVLFVGHYQAAPNHDAATHLAREVMPLLRARCPGCRLVLAGSDPGEDIRALAAPDVEVPGWVPDLSPRLAKAAVFAAAIRFGSGIKGKLLQAIAHGVPLVASEIAVEGIGLVAERDYLPADTPRAFADALARVLTDPALGARLAAAARDVLGKRFSKAAVWRQFDAAFAPLLR